MKTKYYSFVAALAVLALASCAKEEIYGVDDAPAKVRTFVLDLGTVDTRTNITESGKTVWCQSDTVVLTDGTNTEKICVPDAAAGDKTAEITTTTITGDVVYAVYPKDAIGSPILTEDGKLNVKIPSDQGGDFADANIMVGRAADMKFAMKNAASVLKIHVAEGIQQVVFNASGDALSGKLTVGFAEDNSISDVNASASTGIVTLNAMGGNADFYVAVAPGTYKAGFNMLALDSDGKFESKSTKSENTLTWNNLSDLGTIGNADNLKGLSGEGTEASPYLITNLGEMLAFANTVNVGNKYSGKFLKLTADIEGVTLPAGYYISESDQGPFGGNFDGDNHTVTINIDGDNCKSKGYVALFGVVDAGATIKNINVAGTASGSAPFVGGLIGSCRGAKEDTVWVSNCSSSVKVTSSSERVGGISGYATYAVFDNCRNTGDVTGDFSVGGVVGYGYQGTIANCSNTGAVTGNGTCGRVLGLPQGGWRFSDLDATNNQGNYSFNSNNTRGIGGIIGYSQNLATKVCTNSGAVSGVNKVGGIVGTEYWASTTSCVNNGTVTASKDCAGGILGWGYIQAKSTEDVNNGAVSARCMAGGLVGMANGSTSNAAIEITGGKNTGTVYGAGGIDVLEYNYKFGNVSAAGGIVGGVRELSNGSNRDIVRISGCENSADVTGAGLAVGGVVGYSARPLNNVLTGYVEKSKNTGKVTGLTHVGGIVGLLFHRFTNCSVRVSDCENSGDVLSSSTDAVKVYAGGIVGWTQSAYPASGGQSKLYNDINTGCVVYTSEAAVTPYVGGIVGSMQQTTAANVYNSGSVKFASGTAPDGADDYTGAVAGFVGTQTTFNHVYYLSGSGPKAVGMVGSGIALGDVVSEADDSGNLVLTEGGTSSPNMITVFETDCTTLLEALNAWVDKNASFGFYKWAAGPVHVKE